MKGTTNLSPGVRVRSYLPSFSTTQACCCGTILMVRMMKRAATTATMRANSMGCAPWRDAFDVMLDVAFNVPLLAPASWAPMRVRRDESVRGGGRQHQPVPFDRDDAVRAGRGVSSRR